MGVTRIRSLSFGCFVHSLGIGTDTHVISSSIVARYTLDFVNFIFIYFPGRGPILMYSQAHVRLMVQFPFSSPLRCVHAIIIPLRAIVRRIASRRGRSTFSEVSGISRDSYLPY